MASRQRRREIKEHTPAARALADLIGATNTHDFDRVSPLLAPDVVYHFTDETVRGRAAAREYFERTWHTVRDEEYGIEDVEWLVSSDATAVASYCFVWRGIIDGLPRSGSGRATNVFVRAEEGRWLLAHEHLSPEPGTA